MRALIRFPRRVAALITRIRDTLWYRRYRRNCSWGEAWVRAGWWAR